MQIDWRWSFYEVKPIMARIQFIQNEKTLFENPKAHPH